MRELLVTGKSLEFLGCTGSDDLSVEGLFAGFVVPVALPAFLDVYGCSRTPENLIEVEHKALAVVV
jgi:hypothetical protein